MQPHNRCAQSNNGNTNNGINLYGYNVTINTFNSNNAISNNATNAITTFPVYRGPINRVVEIRPTTSPTKRTADPSLSSPAKKPRTHGEAIAVSAVLNNSEIISICEQKIANGNWGAAKTIILNNTTLDDNEKAELCNKLCFNLLSDGHFTESNIIINSLMNTIRCNSNNLANLLSKLSVGYYYLKVYSEAEKAANSALELTDDDNLKSRLHNNLSMIYFAQNDFPNAILAADKGLAIKSLSEKCKSSLSSNLELAKEALFEIELNKNKIEEEKSNDRRSVFACINLCKENQDNPSLIIDFAKKGLELSFTAEQKNKLKIYLFDALFAQKRFKEAKKIVDPIIANKMYKFNLSIEWHIRKTRVLIKLEKWEFAENHTKKAIEEFSDVDCDSLGELYFYLSEINLHYNKIDEAKINVENGLKLSNLSQETKDLLNGNLTKINKEYEKNAPVPMTPFEKP